MAYDEALADRLRELTTAVPGLSEKKMFGGLAFLVHGNMAIAASGQGGLLVRVDPDESAALTKEPGVEVMVMRGREMPGWLRVDATADDDLTPWVDRGVGFASSLPPK
jgi:TfoX/Sxy family transcriptional regulator of competence genes